MRVTRRLLPALSAAWILAVASAAAAAPEGTLTIALHFSPVTRWLDPAEGESTITPYLLLYVLHDALLKPNRTVIATLKAEGLPVTAIETPGHHQWPVWRDNLIHFAPLLFQK